MYIWLWENKNLWYTTRRFLFSHYFQFTHYTNFLSNCCRLKYHREVFVFPWENKNLLVVCHQEVFVFPLFSIHPFHKFSVKLSKSECIWQRNNYIGLISVQNWTFGWICIFFYFNLGCTLLLVAPTALYTLTTPSSQSDKSCYEHKNFTTFQMDVCCQANLTQYMEL